MISRTKKIAYGAALAASTGMLMPVLLKHFGAEERAPRAERPASEDAGTLSAVSAPAPRGDTAPPASARGAASTAGPESARTLPLIVMTDDVPGPIEPAGPSASEGPADALVSSLEASLVRLENFGTAATLPDLDALASTWGARADEGAPALLSDPLAAAAWGEFLAEHPLRGIIHGGERPAALLGGRVVRAGDVLLPGVASVERIDPRGITLLYRGSEATIDLPPLRPMSKPSLTPSSAGGDAPGSAPGGGAPEASAPKEERDA